MNRLCQNRMPLPLSRRQMLAGAATGFGGLALRSLMADEVGSTLTEQEGSGFHYPPKVKRVIFLFMHGGPSHIDTFDYKPLLKRDCLKDLKMKMKYVVLRT